MLALSSLKTILNGVAPHEPAGGGYYTGRTDAQTGH
jgi:hypothetical protein